MKEKLKQKITAYAVAIAIPLAVGVLSALFTKGNMSLFTEIKMPPLSPPAWLFPVVWTLLFTLMGISSAIVYLNSEINPTEAKMGLTTYAISLAVNFLWSIFFFNMRLFWFSFIWLVLLLALIVKTVIHYKKISSLAAYLQIPYIIWVAFAGYLNLAIAILN